MGFCDFGPPGNVVRMAVAACLWPTTFQIPSVLCFSAVCAILSLVGVRPLAGPQVHPSPARPLIYRIPAAVAAPSTPQVAWDRAVAFATPQNRVCGQTQNLPNLSF